MPFPVCEPCLRSLVWILTFGVKSSDALEIWSALGRLGMSPVA